MTSGYSQGSKDSKAIYENYLATSGLWSPTGDNLIEHDCATHVHHEMYGNGECLKEQHHLDETGNVDWYTVQFEHGVEQIPTSNLTVLQFEKHSHGTMKKEKKSLEEIATSTVGGQKFASHSRDPDAPKAGTKLGKDGKPLKVGVNDGHKPGHDDDEDEVEEDVKMAGGSAGVTGGWEQREDSSRFRKIK